MINLPDKISQLVNDLIKEYEENPLKTPEDSMQLIIALPGNWEPQSKLINDIIDLLLSSINGSLVTHPFIIHDNDDDLEGTGWTNLSFSFILNKNITEYLTGVTKKIKNFTFVLGKNQSLANALNKAIIICDNYNNMFGDQNGWNKTEQIQELDRILKQAK